MPDLNEKQNVNDERKIEKVPLLALRDLVIFPNMVIPLFVGREKSIKALETAMERDRIIFLVAQKDARTDDPKKKDIFEMGTISEILQILKLPDGAIRVLVEGLTRGKIKEYLQEEPFFEVSIERINENTVKTKEIEALMRMIMDEFQKYVRMNKKIPPETLMSVSEIDNPGRLADVIAAHIYLKNEEKQNLLEMEDPAKRLQQLSSYLQRENEILDIEKKIQGKVKSQLEKSQREYYLYEQLKAIQKELGKTDSTYNEVEELREKIKKAKMSKDAEDKALKELSRLEKMMPMSAEATVIRTYLDWLIALPWNFKTKEKIEIKNVEKILEEDHFGLEKPKERIIEYLAVKKNIKDKKVTDPILCFVGPPGVGKTSLAKSIARAMGRNFVRISLGGVRDEAEIRGHRRTYIGAMPGRIIQSIRKAKSKNPVFLMDEIDKMSSDFRGDPAAALLEVLDPEQNNTFMDHYLDTEFDLSDVMFITTANTLYNIPLPLQDRMEIIEINSYTDFEKLNIAQKFLIPKQLKQHGLTDKDVQINEKAVLSIINNYTKEAGVRNLEREIKTVCRKVAKAKVSETKFKKILITEENIDKFLGVPKFLDVPTKDVNGVGIATGLAWTEFGGDVLIIEVSIFKGKGTLILTGKLGDVMKESGQAALSYIRSKAKKLGIKEDVFSKTDVHVHVPEGAIPKDGPSAGITIATSLISAFTGKPVKKDVAMTGEITLTGRVLPIGGLKEKTLAAHRNGIKEVIIPEFNRKDYTELPDYIKKNLKFYFVKTMDEVIKIAIEKKK
ncbi:MAG: endopeptidase La [Candidatus Goldbacteria bacterium]|nr:endopeptidase La [Candidatus Goldiibacteriota bacterium]